MSCFLTFEQVCALIDAKTAGLMNPDLGLVKLGQGDTYPTGYTPDPITVQTPAGPVDVAGGSALPADMIGCVWYDPDEPGAAIYVGAAGGEPSSVSVTADGQWLHDDGEGNTTPFGVERADGTTLPLGPDGFPCVSPDLQECDDATGAIQPITKGRIVYDPPQCVSVGVGGPVGVFSGAAVDAVVGTVVSDLSIDITNPSACLALQGTSYRRGGNIQYTIPTPGDTWHVVMPAGNTIRRPGVAFRNCCDTTARVDFPPSYDQLCRQIGPLGTLQERQILEFVPDVYTPHPGNLLNFNNVSISFCGTTCLPPAI